MKKMSDKLFFLNLFLILSLFLSFQSIFAKDDPNEIMFTNQSGEPALVKVVGPTLKEVKVPNKRSETVNVTAGNYYILVRYGIPGTYRYAKGDPFDVTQTETKYSSITITLHKVSHGDYATKPIAQSEFEKVSTVEKSLDTNEVIIEGYLLNEDTKKPIVNALVVLCPKEKKKLSCVIGTKLTSVTDKTGKFIIKNVTEGKHIVLYNFSGRTQKNWSGIKLDYSPYNPHGVSVKMYSSDGKTLLNIPSAGKLKNGTIIEYPPSDEKNPLYNLIKSTQSSLEAYGDVNLGILDGEAVLSGYLYSEKIDLIFHMIESKLENISINNDMEEIKLLVSGRRK